MDETSSSEQRTLQCIDPNCDWKYPCTLFQPGDSLQLIKMHMDHAHRAPDVQTVVGRGPKFEAPSIDTGIDQEAWVAFTLRWEQYCKGSGISRDLQSLRLFQCSTEMLGNLLLKANPRITDCTPEIMLEEMHRLAVIQTAKGVAIGDLLKMCQSNDEPFRTFAARVQGRAHVCGFVTKERCVCGHELSVNYTEEMVKHVILAGISDESIRTSVLETEAIEERKLNEIISLVERKEKARKPHRAASISATSSFKRQNTLPTQPPKESRKIPCPGCQQLYRKFNGKNIKPFEVCIVCFRNSKVGRKSRKKMAAGMTSEKVEAALLQQDGEGCTSGKGYNESVACLHIIGELTQFGRSHPKLKILINPVGLEKSVSMIGIADTGAQSNLMGMNEFIKAGFSKAILRAVPLNIRAANQQSIDISGGFLANLAGPEPKGGNIKCQAMILVSGAVSGLYISFDTLIKLKAISNNFPVIGALGTGQSDIFSVRSTLGSGDTRNRLVNQGCTYQLGNKSSCTCPQRSAVPLRPKTLPFEPKPENNELMKQWLLQYFGASTFNTCPHRPLQEMAGPPIAILVDKNATPKACYTPAHIPLHWQQRVYDDIKRDEALGVLEKVPYGKEVTWCHRLVVTRKHDGSPRRTVDLSPLNKFCRREAHGAESPYHLARRIPRDTWKTVSDAWNGYHSVPLRKQDRHLTTFITPFGKWRYTRAPQGYLSSGDGYNRRFQAILENFPRKERCVDDTLHYDDDLEDHYWRTIDFLIMVGQSGIVLNPEKLQFACKTVDFAGFRISRDTVEPLPKYLEAIQNFPKPTSTTDIKSWFGLVNQVSQYAQLRNIMAPFRRFLSPRVKFEWNSILDEAFEKSKSVIVETIRHGVEIFDINRPTCLRPDWSRQGIGFFLLQKHCECVNILPNCCASGWKTTLAGSRFLSDTESRYAAIEGEALAIAWGLEQTKYFTQGCDKLLVVTDHKPLVGVFGDRTLDAITNTRLFRLKQRTLQWKFNVAYLPGRTNVAADATSRHPSPSSTAASLSYADIEEEMMVAAICQEACSVTSIDWKTIADETERDSVLSELKKAIDDGFSGEYKLISDFFRYRSSLFVQDGVVLYKDRVVVPSILRSAVLDSLHSAHQGVSSMQLRAQSIIFWPGMTRDIASRRERCSECDRNAPSNAALPAITAECPSTPFEQIVADFFEFGGRRYLVAADRLSGYSEVFFTPSGTAKSGARGLISCLREWFRLFGVPEQLSSDGGTEFTADSTRGFLKTWGVTHRISAAYNPQSNGRAEVAVKTVKRLMRSNIDTSGNLNTDKFLQAMLQLRNTPDQDCGISPAEIVFGRKLQDNLKFSTYVRRRNYSNRWQQAWASKEDALRTRFARTVEKLNAHARDLPPLALGQTCLIQNQRGHLRNRWHQTGTVVEILPYDRYVVRVHGSRNTTTRNRRFLRKYTPYRDIVPTFDDLEIREKDSVEYTNPPVVEASPECTSPPIVTPEDPDDPDVSSKDDQPPVNTYVPQHDSPPRGNAEAPPSHVQTPPHPRQVKEKLCLRRIRSHLEAGPKEKPLHSRRRPESKFV